MKRVERIGLGRGQRSKAVAVLAGFEELVVLGAESGLLVQTSQESHVGDGDLAGEHDRDRGQFGDRVGATAVFLVRLRRPLSRLTEVRNGELSQVEPRRYEKVLDALRKTRLSFGIRSLSIDRQRTNTAPRLADPIGRPIQSRGSTAHWAVKPGQIGVRTCEQVRYATEAWLAQ